MSTQALKIDKQGRQHITDLAYIVKQLWQNMMADLDLPSDSQFVDYDLLKETIDVFSPMVYHGRMGREPEWVEENINWFSIRMGIKKGTYPKVWPIVQASNNPDIISAEDFRTVLTGGLAGKSSGVMMYTTNAVASDPSKTEVMKNIYSDPAIE